MRGMVGGGSTIPRAARRVGSRVAGETEEEAGEHRSGRRPSATITSESRLIERVTKNPRDAGGWNNLGVALRKQGKLHDAIACYRRALAIEAGSALVLGNLGNALKDIGRHDEAVAVHQRASRIAPDDAGVWSNLAVSLQLAGRFEDALGALDRSLGLAPRQDLMRFDRALLNLRLRHWQAGWKDYEARWAKPQAQRRDFPIPRWEGEPLAGRRVFLYPEQGFGDTLFAARFVPLVPGTGGTATLECRPELRRLFDGLGAHVELADYGQRHSRCELHCPLMSLPGVLAVDGDVPPPPVTLTIPAAARARAASLLPSEGASLRVGIVWSGSVTFEGNAQRAATLENFLRLLDVPGVELYSLQKGPPADELAQHGRALLVHDLGSQLDDFADTAAVIERLDLVVMTDSSVAHLAGSLGRPVWNLLQTVPYWMYGDRGTLTPWYPSMRLFRQSRLGDWNGVFDSVCEALRDEMLRRRIAQRQPSLEVVLGTSAADITDAVPANAPREAVRSLLAEAAAALDRGDSDRAATIWQGCRSILPDDPATLHLGALIHAKKRPALALDLVQSAVLLAPGNAAVHCTLGDLLFDCRRVDDAAGAYVRALELAPDFVVAHNNLGNVCKLQGRLEEAKACFENVLAARPDLVEAWVNYGATLAQAMRLDEAEAAYRRALELRPDYANAHWNYGLLLLQTGRYSQGWLEYEWRWKVPKHAGHERHVGKPRWTGESLPGGTILLHAEQGLGDTLQFVRFAPQVRCRVGRVVVQCPSTLVRLLRTVPGVDAVVADGEPIPPHDVQCSLMSLPAVFGTTLDTIPRDVPYLAPSEPDLSRWQNLVDTPAGTRRVGIAWAGGARDHLIEASVIDRRRSIAPELLTSLLSVAGVQFFSLQYGTIAHDVLDHGAANAVADLMGEVRDYADTATLVAHLDLVITVDTSVAHLAGAMGKPVWTLSRFDGCWRWLVDRSDSPWYPTMKLFRQSMPGDWEGVLDAVEDELRRSLADDRRAISRSDRRREP